MRMCKVREANAYYHFREVTKMVIGFKKELHELQIFAPVD